MNFRKFHNHVYELCRIEDARSIQISMVVIKNLKKLTRIKVKNRPIDKEFQVKNPPI